MVLGSVKFGFVGTYLSEPLVRAYTTAAAAHAVVAQLKYIFGVSPTRFSGPLSLVYVSTLQVTLVKEFNVRLFNFYVLSNADRIISLLALDSIIQQ